MTKPEYIDTHCHLNFAAYDTDREEVIKRAREANTWVINVGTQADTSKKAVELAEQNDGMFAIVGLHPIHTNASYHDTSEFGDEGKAFTSRGEDFDSTEYEKLVAHPKVVGIGECGLDYFRLDEQSEARQRQAFEKHIDLAEKLRKPLMLHVRNPKTPGRSAYRDAAEMLRGRKVTGNAHFFAGSIEEAKLFLDMGFTISFTGVITFTSDYDLLVRYAPLNMILSETDAPYVTPAPHRGKRNEPAYVEEVVKKMAEIRKEDCENVKKTLIDNAFRVFGLGANS